MHSAQLLQLRIHRILVMLIIMLFGLSYAPIARATNHSPSIANVRVTAGDGLAYLRWDPPFVDVTDYAIEYCLRDKCNRVTTQASSSPAMTVTGLSNNQPYTFRVFARQGRRLYASSALSEIVTPRSAFFNGSFEVDSESVSIPSLTGWTLVGHNASGAANRIDLGVTMLGGCQSQDTTNYQTLQLRGSDAPEDDDPISIDTFITQTSLVTWMSEATPTHGMNMLMLKNDVLAGPPLPNGHHVIHGPALVSDVFSATAGQIVTLDWYARYVRDDYAILGYLLDTATCTQYEIIDASGDRVLGWQHASLPIPATKSTYRLVFVHGTFDKSGGRFSGAEIYIDNITVGTPQTINFPTLSAKNVTDPAFSLAATSSTGLTIEYLSLTPTICGVAGAVVTLINVGECTIQAGQSGGVVGGTTYAASPKVNRSFAVTGFTPTRTPTNTATPTNTFTPTQTFTPSRTPTQTFTPTNTLTPTQTFTPSPTLSRTPHPLALRGIAVGASFTLAVMNNGTLVTWGFNRDNQASIPSTLANIPIRQVSVGSNYAIALGENGRVYGWGKNDFGQLTIPTNALRDVTAVSASLGHVMALKTDGSLVLWGRNSARQLNQPANQGPYSAIAAGHEFSIAVRRHDGSVIGWGKGTQNQLNIPRTLRNVTAVSAGFDHTLALTRDGTVVCWGANRQRQCVVPTGLRDVTAISAGREYSLAMTKEGVVYAWGRNDYGQAKVPRLPFAATSIGAGYVNSVVGLRDAKVIAFGDASLGSLVSRTPTRTP